MFCHVNLFLWYAIVSLRTIIVKHFFSWWLSLIWLHWMLAAISLMRFLRWIKILRAVNVSVVLITREIRIVNGLWSIIISRSWGVISLRLLLVIVISIRKLSLNWRIVEGITIKVKSCSLINELRLQIFMWILNYSYFISPFNVIFKSSFNKVISVNKLVMILPVVISVTISLTFSWIMSFMEVLISTSVSYRILLIMKVVSHRIIIIETSLRIKIIVISSLTKIWISLVVILTGFGWWFIFLWRTLSYPEKFLLSIYLFLDFFILGFNQRTVLYFSP